MALLKQLSTSLDTYNGTKSPQAIAGLQKSWPKPTKTYSGGDASKSATKNFLAVKTLVKGMVKACIQENVTVTEQKSIGVIDSLVEEYRSNRGYPSVTKQMVANGVKKAQEGTSKDDQNTNGKTEGDDIDDELKLARCIQIVDDEMDEYFDKIDALKRKREKAATEPEQAPSSSKKRKSTGGGGGGDGNSGSSPKGRVGRPRGRVKSTPESRLIDEITERYTKARQDYDRLPNGKFEAIVEETKKELGMEDFALSLANIRKRVTWFYLQRADKGVSSSSKKKTELVDEIYRRYARAKEMNGGKLQPGTLESIVEGVKLEYGMVDVKMATLETKIQQRFKKDNPEFKSTPEGILDIGQLSEEDNRRRQILFNEVTARYVKRKEEGPKKLPDGELDRIIEQTKQDLGILDFDVPKASIRGRINRKSLHVMTLGSHSPYDIIDDPLVETINGWLKQGISVTRAQGLEFANALLKGKEREKDSEGKEILLDAKWWRNFLERNKKKLACASG